MSTDKSMRKLVEECCEEYMMKDDGNIDYLFSQIRQKLAEKLKDEHNSLDNEISNRSIQSCIDEFKEEK